MVGTKKTSETEICQILTFRIKMGLTVPPVSLSLAFRLYQNSHAGVHRQRNSKYGKHGHPMRPNFFQNNFVADNPGSQQFVLEFVLGDGPFVQMKFEKYSFR
jgi:hypothetical protein